MKFAWASLMVLISFLIGLPLTARAQEQPDESNARGLFLKTREGQAPTPPAEKTPAPRNKSAPAAYPLGLGYSLYQRDVDGHPVRVETKNFRAGDALRLVIEANTSGYLYVFGTTNGAEPMMIFPNVRLNEGDNHIKAHVPYEIPSNAETIATRRWFTFNVGNVTEQVFLIFTRAPLPTVVDRHTFASTVRARRDQLRVGTAGSYLATVTQPTPRDRGQPDGPTPHGPDQRRS